jgi:outer membrane protein TolC
MRRISFVLLVIVTLGCSRQAYRERTDLDVEGVITQKNTADEWKVENWHVYPDSRARFADPACPDFPSYPPDDYAAYVHSPNPQRPGEGGSGRHEGDGYLRMIEAWDQANRAEDSAEDAKLSAGPALVNSLSSKEKAFRLRLDQAVELAILNSREFQDRREDLYLAALPVTQERFGFAAQAFAAESLIREATGSQRPEGRGNRWRIGTNAGLSREFATGAQLLVNFANQVVVDITGPKPSVSLTNMSLTFIQPFLRGGGYAVTLEALTQAERTLLYAIRSYARFRKVFYVVIAGQGDYTNNPYGLQGLAANLGRAIGNNLTAPQAGYLPTILQAATLANQQRNVASLEQFLKLFQNLREGGQTSELQIVRVEQQLLQGRTQVLLSQRQYLDAVDNFKLQLGVPATLPIELDDGPLRPVRKQLQRFEAVYTDITALQAAAERYEANDEPALARTRWKSLFADSALTKGTAFSTSIFKEWNGISSLDDNALEARRKETVERRRKLQDEKAARELANKPEPATEAPGLTAVEDVLNLIRFEQALRSYESMPWRRQPAESQASVKAGLFRNALEAGMLVAVRGKNERLAQLREQWPPLPPFTLDGREVTEIPIDEAYVALGTQALNNRLDLMNARAQVVDAWRQIAVRANALQGVFDVQYSISSASPSNESELFGFSGSRTRHQVALRFEPPIVRRVERNAYRASLISFQRQRRILMAFEDNIITDGRQDLRQLRQFAETYKIQQRAIEIAYAQVDNARNTFVAPPDPGVGGGGNQASVAALTEQLLNAQGALVQTQNQLFVTWINSQNIRLNLALDLELLPLDSRGLWTDDFSQRTPSPTPEIVAPPPPGNPRP